MYSVAKPRIAIPATFMGPINTPRPAIPSELYRNIIEWVADTQDLCNLSLTSRICCTEAQRILYRVVDLAQNTRAPVLWASTILEHPRRAEAVRALTLRFDLSFLIVPDMMLSPLELISRALRTLRKLEKLVLVGHPKVMMHPIHSWILDGCTAHLNVFHNFVFPASSIIPFLSRQPNLRQWTQMGVFHGEIIRDTLMPQLTELDVHASALPCFTTPRPLVRVRLKIDDHGGREKTWERKAIQSLALFGSTLSTLIIEHSSISNHLAPVEVFGVLIEATPNLKTLVYTLMSNLDEVSSKQRAHNLV
ncbi:hypothetical protein D9615_002758 [Tricholomella constricta]|uniref:F-box domain-containing protein n=1 Tax=Tricholomella constricta TaxID=117010 RepID=A0A8H5HGE1_9AGAR|nr:hypothetical protein D9615_002758 [Tricholomella constricta]